MKKRPKIDKMACPRCGDKMVRRSQLIVCDRCGPLQYPPRLPHMPPDPSTVNPDGQDPIGDWPGRMDREVPL